MFVKDSDFVGIINVDTSNIEMSNILYQYIDSIEKEILVKYALGTRLYNEFISGLSEPVIEQKWLDLRDGKTYDITLENGAYATVEYKGIAEILKYFVYYYFAKENYQSFNNTSFNQQISENSETLNPVFRFSDIFNKGVERLGFIINDGNTLSENKLSAIIDNTLFNFISHSNSEEIIYNDWIFREIEKINGIGI